ncbi:MAG: DUF1028 domain-containing protein [Pseudomonadota bacterium]
MTYTIIGHCPKTGQTGLAIATVSLNVAAICPTVSRHGDIVCSQAYTNRRLGALGARCLSDGMGVAETMARLADNDGSFGFRQLAIVSKAGEAAAHTGEDCSDWKGHQIGDGYVAMGNVLAGPEVVGAMATAFEGSADQPLQKRLMTAIEAGRDAGGQAKDGRHITERSAGLVVYGWDDDGYPDTAEINVRVDAHPTAVAELRRQYEMIRHLNIYQHMKADDPAILPTTEDWETKHMTAVRPPPWYD